MPSNLKKKQVKRLEFPSTTAQTITPTSNHDGRPALGVGEGAATEESEEAVADTALAAVQTLQRLMGEVSATLQRLSEKVEASASVVRQHGGRLVELEERVGSIEDGLAPLKKENLALQAQVRELQKRAEDQEGRARRHNVRIIGVPEGLTARKPEHRMEVLIRQALPNAKLSQYFLLERAHRTLQQQPPPGAPPRPVICRVFNFRDRDAILAASREAGEINWEGHRLSFYPDFTMQVQQQRKKFQEVKRMLQAKNVPYAMLFPSRLRIQHNGKAQFFSEPAAAVAYIEQQIRSPLGEEELAVAESARERWNRSGRRGKERSPDPELAHLAEVIDSWVDRRSIISDTPSISPRSSTAGNRLDDNE